MKVVLKVVVVLWLFGGLAAAGVEASESRTIGLFDPDSQGRSLIQSHSLPQADLSSIRRIRPVAISGYLGRADDLAPGDRLILDLFEDALYTAVIDRVTTNINGTVTVRARIENHPLGYVLLSTTDGRTLGEICLPEHSRRFRIKPGADRRDHFVAEMRADALDELEGSRPLIPPSTDGDIQALSYDVPMEAQSVDVANVDIMVVYTPAARDWASGSTDIANVIAQAMEKANLVLDNSETLMTMTLVHSAMVDYTETGNSSTDLERLRSSNDGYMDEVHAWRDTYGADLVALFAKVDDTGGLAWLLTSPGGSPGYGFSLTRVQQASGGYTHIHEMGHNMGTHHHKEQTVQPGPGIYDYSAGWRWTTSGNSRYCSVMTYASGLYFPDGRTHTQVAYFSNPDVLHLGVPTGDAADGDNARTVRNVRHVIAGYRPTSIAGDLDGNGIVGAEDLVLFTSRWLDSDCGPPGWCGGADIDTDGNVSFTDFAILAGNWLIN